jgi:ABC-2 type transport system ATP-binding protein
LTFATPAALDTAARKLGGSVTRDSENLTLQVPSDGSAHSVQAVLNKIDSKAVVNLSLHTPDLDDVYFALTGHDTKKDES